MGSPYLHDLNMNHTYGHFAAGMRLLEVYMSLQMERVGVMLMMGSPHFAYTLGTLKVNTSLQVSRSIELK